MTEGGSSDLEAGQQVLDGVGDGDGVGAGLALNSEDDGALVFWLFLRNQEAVLSSSTLSTTRPSSSRRTGEPLR